jgi:3-isopropylmalate/(R)-2-methylmalate dehydratase large subunit
MTFAEKILARKSGKERVEPGDIVTARPDICLSHDNTAAIAKTFAKIGVERVFDPDRLVFILDHCTPAADSKHAENHKTIREFVKAHRVRNFYDINTGICHQVLPEKGHVVPGELVVGSDSHTTTHGAFGALAIPIGRSEMAATWATGELWFRVPQTIKITLAGSFLPRVGAKDLILRIIGDVGAAGADYRSVEFTGPLASAMTIPQRMTMCNMTIEMGAKCGSFDLDDTTRAWLRGRVTKEYTEVHADPDAACEQLLTYDASGLVPQVACPHRVDNVKPVGEVAGTRIDQVVIGTCTNGQLEDLHAAAAIFKGRCKADRVRLLVFPGSMETYRAALDDGTLATFLDGGALVLNPNCGPCLGAHEGALASGEVCFSTTNRNFKGRMGNPDSEIYLGSPATAAASAIRGEIADPRDA